MSVFGKFSWLLIGMNIEQRRKQIKIFGNSLISKLNHFDAIEQAKKVNEMDII